MNGEPLLISLSVTVTREEYMDAARLYFKVKNRTGPRRLTQWAVLLLLSLCTGLSLLLVIAGGVGIPVLLLPCALLGVTGALCFGQRALLRASAGRAYDQMEPESLRRSLFFIDSGIEEALPLPGGRVMHRWEELDAAAEDRGLFALFLKDQALLLPASCMDEDAAVYFHNLLAEKMQGRFRYFAPLRAHGALCVPAAQEAQA